VSETMGKEKCGRKDVRNGDLPFRDVKMTPDISGPCSPSAFTIWEVAVVVIIILLSLSVVLPYVSRSGEAARRMHCSNQLKQIGLALHNYAQANRMFPPGTICASRPTQPANQYDVWGEAATKGKGVHGTSFLLAILPYLESELVYRQWDFRYGVAYNAEHGLKPAVCEMQCLYCPSRRSAFRANVDNPMMLTESWTGGGTDYGGCTGRHAAFTNRAGYNLCDATMHYDPDFQPKDKEGKLVDDAPQKRLGVFGRVNVGTKFDEITDGMGLTIMTGELQRITTITSTITPGSKDGWAIGGPATLFTTGALVAFDENGTRNVVPPDSGAPLNNKFWGSPGSEHVNVANFGMADGAVRAINVRIDPSVFALLGSMADASPLELD